MIIRTSLGLCGVCEDDPVTMDGKCECAVDMPVCDICERGPLDDGEHLCGGDRCTYDPNLCGMCGGDSYDLCLSHMQAEEATWD